MRRSIGLRSAMVAAALALLASTPVQAAAPKITICHKPPGNPDNAHTIRVSIHAWPAHKAHDDTLGECADGNGGAPETGGGGGGSGNTGGGVVSDGTFEITLCDGRKGNHGHSVEVSRTGQIRVKSAECQ